MGALLIVILAGIGIGLARGGSLKNLVTVKVRFMGLLYVAVALQLGAQFVPESASIWAYAMVVSSYAAVFVVAGANYRIPGMLVVALGALCNFTVILANQGMPISETAARASGHAPRSLLLRGKHYLDAGTAHLRFLGDNIALHFSPSIISVGDIIIWIGIVVILQDLMQPASVAQQAKPAPTT
jgi:hypothetical protein